MATHEVRVAYWLVAGSQRNQMAICKVFEGGDDITGMAKLFADRPIDSQARVTHRQFLAATAKA